MWTKVIDYVTGKPIAMQEISGKLLYGDVFELDGKFYKVMNREEALAERKAYDPLIVREVRVAETEPPSSK